VNDVQEFPHASREVRVDLGARKADDPYSTGEHPGTASSSSPVAASVFEVRTPGQRGKRAVDASGLLAFGLGLIWPGWQIPIMLLGVAFAMAANYGLLAGT
jgi:hypothetical protein